MMTLVRTAPARPKLLGDAGTGISVITLLELAVAAGAAVVLLSALFTKEKR